jgi:uncharacterized protein (TIGR02271 family)
MRHAYPPNVRSKDGVHGSVDADRVHPGERVTVKLEGHHPVEVPAELLSRRPDGTYELPLYAEELDRMHDQHVSPEHPGEPIVVPVVEEQLSVQKRRVEAGGVRIHKHVREKVETVDTPLRHEEVDVERVEINEFVDGPRQVRQEGDVTIIPVMEEVLVVQKRLMLKEEIRLRRRVHETREPQQVTLRREEVEVERVQDSPSNSPQGT